MSGLDDLRAAIRLRLQALTSVIRFGQFLSVGVMGAMFDIVVTLSLDARLGLHPDVAKFVGAEGAILLMFLINDQWTFASEGAPGLVSKGRRLVKSNLVRAGGLGVQLVTYHFVRQLPISLPVLGFDLYRVGAIMIAIGAGFIVNYLAETLFTWRVHAS
ncbi:MAG: GtrA family protein [Halodesulfurarchaeum sp.]